MWDKLHQQDKFKHFIILRQLGVEKNVLTLKTWKSKCKRYLFHVLEGH